MAKTLPARVVECCMQCPYRGAGHEGRSLCSEYVSNGAPGRILDPFTIPEWCPLEDAPVEKVMKAGFKDVEVSIEAGDWFDDDEEDQPSERKDGHYVVRKLLERKLLEKKQESAGFEDRAHKIIKRLSADLKTQKATVHTLYEKITGLEDIISELTEQTETIDSLRDSIRRVLNANKELEELDTEELESSRKLDLG